MTLQGEHGFLERAREDVRELEDKDLVSHIDTTMDELYKQHDNKMSPGASCQPSGGRGGGVPTLQLSG